MKRRDIIKAIDRIAKSEGMEAIYTEGGNHTKVRIGNRSTAIPRHNEVNEITARNIIKTIKGS